MKMLTRDSRYDENKDVKTMEDDTYEFWMAPASTPEYQDMLRGDTQLMRMIREMADMTSAIVAMNVAAKLSISAHKPSKGKKKGKKGKRGKKR